MPRTDRHDDRRAWRRELYAGFADRLRKAREASGLRPGQIATAAGLNTQRVALLATGEKWPWLHELVGLAAALGVPLLWLAAGEGPDVRAA